MFGVLYILLVPLAVLAWRSRAWALMVILACLQAYVVRGSVFGIPTTWLELAVYICFVVACLRGEISWRLLTSFKKQSVVWVLAAGLWLALCVVGVLVAQDTRLAAGILKGWVIDPMLLSVLTISVLNKVKVQDQARAWRWGIGALLAGACLTTFEAIAQSSYQHLARLQSGFDSPNTLAMYLVFALLAGALWLFQPGEWRLFPGWLRWAWSLALLVVAGGVLGTGSYAALVSLGVGVVAWVVSQRGSMWLRHLFATALLVCGLALPFFLVWSGQWFGPSHRNPVYGTTSGEVRLTLWKYALQLGMERPLVGYGLGQWQPVFTKAASQAGLFSYKKPGLAIELTHASLFPHNLWLATWLQLGVFGVAVLATLAYMLLTFVAAPAPLRWLVSAVAAAVLAHSIVDTPVFRNDLAVLWWLLIAVAYSLVLLPKPVTHD